MKGIFALMAAMALAVGISGCTQTEGESESMGDKVGNAMEDATESIADFATDATMATTVTPQIKSAIIADPDLNDPANVIDVSSTDRKVILSGHVASAGLKAQAEKIARGWLDRSAAPDDVLLVNDLVVR